MLFLKFKSISAAERFAFSKLEKKIPLFTRKSLKIYFLQGKKLNWLDSFCGKSYTVRSDHNLGVIEVLHAWRNLELQEH